MFAPVLPPSCRSGTALAGGVRSLANTLAGGRSSSLPLQGMRERLCPEFCSRLPAAAHVPLPKRLREQAAASPQASSARRDLQSACERHAHLPVHPGERASGADRRAVLRQRGRTSRRSPAPRSLKKRTASARRRPHTCRRRRRLCRRRRTTPTRLRLPLATPRGPRSATTITDFLQPCLEPR